MKCVSMCQCVNLDLSIYSTLNAIKDSDRACKNPIGLIECVERAVKIIYASESTTMYF